MFEAILFLPLAQLFVDAINQRRFLQILENKSGGSLDTNVFSLCGPTRQIPIECPNRIWDVQKTVVFSLIAFFG